MADEPKSVPEITHRTDNAAHGIENAFYCGGSHAENEPYFQAVMECCCGFRTKRCLSWEDAGEQFDWHLVNVGAA
jgi:hypothetical protein